jgi:hypothetical protein
MNRDYTPPHMVENQTRITPGSGDPRDLVAPVNESTLIAAANGATYSEFQLTRTGTAAAPVDSSIGAGSGLDVPTSNPFISGGKGGVDNELTSASISRSALTYDPRAQLGEGRATLPEDILQQV